MASFQRSSTQVSLQNVKHAIRSTGLTQRVIAKQLGIDETKLSKTLAGQRRFTDAELESFLEITGTTLAELQAEDAVELSSRDRIIESAWQLFATHGYERVRLADIAQAVGLAPASVLYYFNSKSDIFLVSLHHTSTMSAQLELRALDSSSTSVEQLQQFIHGHLPTTAQRRLAWALWLQFWGSSPTHQDVQQATVSSYNMWHSTIADMVSAAQSDGWLLPDPHLAEKLTTFIDGLGIRIMTGVVDNSHADQLLEEFLSVYLQPPDPT